MANIVLRPWLFLVIGIAGWINRDQQAAIEYLRTENQALREVVGTKRILLNDDQRRRLAVKGRILGLSRLREVAGIFTPETILCWYPQLIAQKWDYSHQRKASAGHPLMKRGRVQLKLDPSPFHCQHTWPTRDRYRMRSMPRWKRAVASPTFWRVPLPFQTVMFRRWRFPRVVANGDRSVFRSATLFERRGDSERCFRR